MNYYPIRGFQVTDIMRSCYLIQHKREKQGVFAKKCTTQEHKKKMTERRTDAKRKDRGNEKERKRWRSHGEHM